MTPDTLTARDPIVRVLVDEGRATEHVVVAIPVRHPLTFELLRTHVIVRAAQTSGDVTLALGPWGEGW